MTMNASIKKVGWMGLERPISYEEDVVIKYACRRKVDETLPLNSDLRCFINRMVINGNCDYPLVDIKLRFHKKGECTCIPGFHYDCVKDYDDPSPHEHHLIWSNIEGTIFENGQRASDGEIWSYGRDLHAGPYVKEDCVRILIRLTQTKKIRPKKFDPNKLMQIHQALKGESFWKK